jgi:Big-like domain-containing protein/concanavalin A-like lectin/glucanase superfamily protein/cellulase (glycosyl hydrolase family 5)
MFTRRQDRTGNSKNNTRLLLGVSLAVMLVASILPVYVTMPAAFAEETFKTFDGTESIQVPSSASLQLPKFSIEVRFRADDVPSERNYLVSKSAGAGILDHNYALYLTKNGAVGAGFQATDGNHYYVYSWQLASLATWHTAALEYDGKVLSLKIDDKTARKLTVGKTPDTSSTGPLEIGGNSNGLNGHFHGDIDYVSIVDKRNNTEVYFNDFGGTAPPPVNSAAVALNDWAWTYEDTPKDKNVLSNDSDPDGDTLTVTSVADPAKGSATNNGDGTVTYTPDLGFVGTDSFLYTISDGKGSTDTATITIQVREVTTTTNNAPNAVDDSATTTKDTAKTTSVLSNDNDPDGDTLTVTSVTNPPHGTATKNAAGTITYMPDAGYVGADTYQYTISDGLATDTATVTVSVSDTAPPPPPPTGTDCSTIPLKNINGVVFNDGTLSKHERATSSTVQTAYVTESFKYIKSNGFNAVRVPFYWESYVNNPTVFMAELDLIAKTAQANNLCVVFSNFHYYTSSYWNLDAEGTSGGKGFPSFVVKTFPTKSDYIQTAGPFWNAFLSNSFSVNGKQVWDLQADYIKSVINKVDNYGSITGYEIMNEPHLFNAQMYEKLGNYHTYLAKEMREVTDKKIFFNRETAWGFTRDPTLEYKIVPRGVSGLVYGAQLYSVPTPGSVALNSMDRFKTWTQEWGTEMFICEMSASTSSGAETFLSQLKSHGFGWTAHSWRQGASNGLGESLFESSSVPPTPALKIMRDALAKIY